MNKAQIEINELPIRSWTDKYKEYLETLLIETGKDKKKSQCLRNYSSQSTDTQVKFTLSMTGETLDSLHKSTAVNADGQNRIQKIFKLTSKINTSNMVLYNAEGFLQKFTDANEILRDYFMVRHDLYDKRKAYQIQALARELKVINARVRFILEFIEDKIKIAKQSKAKLIEQLVTRKYPNLNLNDTQLVEMDTTEIMKDNGYDYLIKMPIYNLTQERIDELMQDRDTIQDRYDKLQSLSIEEIWLGELKVLKNEYQKFLKIKELAMQEEGDGGKKKVVKKEKVKLFNSKNILYLHK